MASIMRFDTLQSTTGNQAMTINASGNINIPGSIVQARYVRSDTRSTYSSSPSGNGNTITDLNITITPKFASSLLVVQWMINGELHQDNVFLIHRNGSLITDTSYTGYNSVLGNVRHSGYASGFYDQNEDSTPSNWFIQYAIPAGSTNSVTFAPAVRSSSTGTYTFSLNRTIAGLSSDAHESMVSSGLIMEIGQ